jgi:multicomponent Na+:H+ antiporter subunit C
MIELPFIELLVRVNHWITVLLMVAGLYIVVARGNMIKKLVGLGMFQTSCYLLYLSPAKIFGATPPIMDPDFSLYTNPLPSVLMLTAIVVGIATQAVGLALVARIKESYGSIEEEDIFDREDAMRREEDQEEEKREQERAS